MLGRLRAAIREPFTGTYMVFGGIETNRDDMFTKFTVVGMPGAEMSVADVAGTMLARSDLLPPDIDPRPEATHVWTAPGRTEPDASQEIDYPTIFAEIDRLGYDGWVGCEYRPAGDTLAGLGWARPYGIQAPE